MLGDLETGEVLYEYNINEQLAMASVTKIMTYLVMMDAVTKGEISLDDDVVISGHAAATEGSNFGVLSGETVKLSLLVKGMLIVSGNDCATAIAEHVGKTEDNFVIMMNSKASELNLMSASFVNPHGLPIDDNETGQNHMSVSDIYKLVRHILSTYPQMLEVTKQPQLVVPERNFNKTATNPILGIVEGADGLKTGYTDKAGLCLVSTMPVKGNGQDYRLIAILMGSETAEERLEKTKTLLEYGKLVNKEDTVRTKITYNQEVKAPLVKGDKVGTISILVNDEEVGQVDATVNENIEKANIFVRIFRFIANLF
ncbi:MAG: D-Ala-D-Ala carboxypeptidase [Sedimentibacter sp.]|nr:D-Ala-D-Ala carboxypeptidase [Sedimentibacter sp.]